MRCQTITRTTLSLTVTLIGLVAAAPVAAQDSPLERCARLEPDAERLACFDAAVTERNEPAIATQEPPAAKAPPEPSSESGQAASEISAETRELPRRLDEKRTIEPDLPKEYQAVVVAMYERPYRQMVVKLDNGEVWSEQYASRAFLVAVGDTITMKQSRFSRSYRLVATGGRGYKMTRLE